MLETMRNASKGWLAAIMIIVLVGSFGIWGVQDMLNLSPKPKIATVGDQDITPERFQGEFARFLREMERQSNTQLSSAQAKALGLDREALDRMLTRLALLNKAKQVGLDISRNQLIDAVKAIPGMSDGQGGINYTALNQVLQNAQTNQDEFLELVRGDMLREQLIRTILSGVSMPPGLDAALNRFRLERRVVEYVLIDPSRAGEIKDPDDAALRKYYATHAAQKYSLPEFRTVTAVLARPADVASKVQVTDDMLKKAYEANRRKYETPEKRVMEQIKFKSEAAALSAKNKIDAGETFEAMAKAEGYKPEDIKLGEVSKTDTTIPAVAFEIPIGTISAPAKGAFGWVILRAVSSTPGSVRTFEEVGPELRTQFVAELSKDKLFELTTEFEDTRGAGATLEEAAKKHNLPAIKVRVDARGNDPTGKTLDNLPGGDFLQRAFAAERGVDSEITETGDGAYYEFRVDEVTPVAKKPFEQVREDVLTDWRAEELEKRLQAIADGLVKRGNGGESMDKIASTLGVAPLRTDPMARFGSNAVLAAETVTAAHDAKKGAFFTGPVADGKSKVVGQLAEIQYADEPPNAPLRATYSSRLRESFASDIAQQFTNKVREEVGVTVDEKRFQVFHTGE